MERVHGKIKKLVRTDESVILADSTGTKYLNTNYHKDNQGRLHHRQRSSAALKNTPRGRPRWPERGAPAEQRGFEEKKRAPATSNPY